MAFLTNTPPFTIGRDVRFSSDGWIVASDQTIDTLAGNDLIDGQSGRTIDIGIEIVGGTLDLGFGKDTVKALGRSSSRDTAGIKLLGKAVVDGVEIGDATIDAGPDADKIRGIATSTDGAAVGLDVDGGKIDAGLSNDKIEGVGTSANGSGSGVELFGGVVDTGFGNDRVVGNGVSVDGDARGIWILEKVDTSLNVIGEAKIDTGRNRDKVTGTAVTETGLAFGIAMDGGKIDTGRARDVITGDAIAGSGLAVGIRLFSGEINTGAGNDVVTGSAVSDSELAFGIFNDGVLDAGRGNDVFDALAGGWSGRGRADLGAGDDVVRGFGSGTFDGGLGTDALTFNAGTYSIERVAGQRGVFQITLASQLDSPVMTVTDFEFFGEGDQQTAFAAAVSAGEITFA